MHVRCSYISARTSVYAALTGADHSHSNEGGGQDGDKNGVNTEAKTENSEFHAVEFLQQSLLLYVTSTLAENPLFYTLSNDSNFYAG